MSHVLLPTLETCVADRLIDLFNFTPDQIAIFFFFFCCGALTCSLIGICLPQTSDKRIPVLISLFICSFALLLVGPSSLLHIPQTKAIVGVGLFLVGAQNVIDTYALSQVLKFTKPSVPLAEYGDLVNSASVLRPVASGLGLLMGPIIGGLILKYIGYAHMSEIYSLVYLIFGVI